MDIENKELIAIIKHIMINNEIYLYKKIVNCYEEKGKIKLVYEDGTYRHIIIKSK